MRLKYAGFATIATILFMTPAANANMLFDIYAGVTAGAGGQTLYLDGDYDSKSAQSYGAILGLDIPLFRAELEYDYLTNQDADMQLAMINAYFKLPVPVIHPYIGAGIGEIFDGKISEIDVKSTVAYQGMLGLTFDIPILPIKVDAEARALYSANVYEFNNASPDLFHYDLRVKLRYIF